MERIEKLKEFLEKTPHDSFLLHALALEHVKLGDDVKARELFEDILKRQPGYVGTYYHLGKLLERCGLTATAIEVYQNGMKTADEAGDRHAFGELKGAYEELTF